jgi:hypothetical protein
LDQRNNTNLPHFQKHNSFKSWFFNKTEKSQLFFVKKINQKKFSKQEKREQRNSKKNKKFVFFILESFSFKKNISFKKGKYIQKEKIQI